MLRCSSRVRLLSKLRAGRNRARGSFGWQCSGGASGWRRFSGNLGLGTSVGVPAAGICSITARIAEKVCGHPPQRGRRIERAEPMHAVGFGEIPLILGNPDKVVDHRIARPCATKRRTHELDRDAGSKERADIACRIDRFDRRQTLNIKQCGSGVARRLGGRARLHGFASFRLSLCRLAALGRRELAA